MHDRERADEIDVRSCELLEWEIEVLILLTVDDHLELPLHEVDGKPLVLRQAIAIELLQVGQSAPGQLHPPMSPFARLRRKLRLENVLFGSGEVPGGGRLVGVHPDPFIGECAEEVVDPAFLRGDGLHGDQSHGEGDTCEEDPVCGHFGHVNPPTLMDLANRANCVQRNTIEPRRRSRPNDLRSIVGAHAGVQRAARKGFRSHGCAQINMMTPLRTTEGGAL